MPEQDDDLSQEIEEIESAIEADEEDEPEHDDAPAAPAPAKAGAGAPKKAAEPEPEPDWKAEAAQLAEKNRQLQGWAATQRRQAAAQEERQARIEARQEKLLAALAKAQGVDVAELDGEPVEKIPSPDEDVVGHILGNVRKELAGIKEELSGREAEKAQREALQRGVQEVGSYHVADVERFVAEHPDYPEAEDWLVQQVYAAEAKNLSFQRPDLTDEDVAQLASLSVTNKIADLQVKYAMGGKSLAAAAYQMAQERGWKPQGAAVGKNGNGKPPKGSPAHRLRETRERAGTSLAATGGSPRATMTMDKLLDLDDDEFAEAVEGKDFKKLAAQLAAQ